jgi:hypothetical protein
MLRRYDQLDDVHLVLQIDGDLDGRKALEEAQELFDLFANELLRRFPEVPVPRGDLDLHRLDSISLENRRASATDKDLFRLPAA